MITFLLLLLIFLYFYCLLCYIILIILFAICWLRCFHIFIFILIIKFDGNLFDILQILRNLRLYFITALINFIIHILMLA